MNDEKFSRELAVYVANQLKTRENHLIAGTRFIHDLFTEGDFFSNRLSSAIIEDFIDHVPDTGQVLQE